MDILIVTSEFYPEVGGIGRSAKRLATSLARENQTVTVLAYDRSDTLRVGPYVAVSEIDGFTLVRIGPLPEKGTEIAPAFKAMLRRQFICTASDWLMSQGAPDVVLSLGITDAGFVGTCLAQKFHLPHVASGRGADVGTDFFLSDKFCFAQWVISNAQAVTFVNQYLLEVAETVFGKLETGRVIANGIACTAATNSEVREQARTRLRDELSIPARGRLLGWVGTFRHKKGLTYLNDMFNTLLERNEDVYLLIVGGPRQFRDRALLPVLDQPSASERVRMTGLIVEPRDVLQYYYAMDLFVYPSIDDGMSNALLEAMSFELPVVATDIFKDVTDNGNAAVLVPRYDSKGLADAVSDLLADPDRAKELASNGRRHVVTHLTETREAFSYVGLFRELLDSRLKERHGKPIGSSRVSG